MSDYKNNNLYHLFYSGDKAEAITQAMSAFVGGLVDGQTPPPVTASTNDLMTLLGAGSVDQQMTSIPLEETETHLMGGHRPPTRGLNPRALLSKIQSALSESLVNKVGESYEFHISGQPGGTYYLDLKNGKCLLAYDLCQLFDMEDQKN